MTAYELTAEIVVEAADKEDAENALEEALRHAETIAFRVTHNRRIEPRPAPRERTEAELAYERANVIGPNGQRVLGPPNPPIVQGRPREVGGWE